MTSKTKKATTAPTPWDHGATGSANRHGLVIEERGEVHPISGKMTNPNKVTGARRVDMLEKWHRDGVITKAGYSAAERLRNAFEATQRGPGTSFEQDKVDSSPKPDHAIDIQVDRISAWHKVNRLVSKEDAPIINHCVAGQGTPAGLRINGVRPYHGRRYQEGLAALSGALDRLAKAMEG